VVIKHLIEHGIKPSVQRIAIMEYLLNNKTHPMVEEIYEALVPQLRTLSKTTVYNTLKLLVENGAVLAIGIEEAGMRYDGDTSDHMHFKCKSCGQIIDIRQPDIPESRKMFVEELKGCQIDQTHIYFKGICKKCHDQKN